MTSLLQLTKPTKQLAYLKKLTGRYGLLQHAKGYRPDPRFGYTLDDNARALTAAIMLADQFGYRLKRLVDPYLSFTERAQLPDGSFVNFFDENGKPLEQRGSEDSLGRAIWALSLLSVNRTDRRLRQKGRQLLNRSLPAVAKLSSTRGIANALVAAVTRVDAPQVRKLAGELAHRINRYRKRDWVWFEPVLSYDNGLVAMALAESAQLLKDRKMLSLAQEVFSFLDISCRVKGIPAPIGNKGWYRRGGKRAVYDQQPIDPTAMVLAACSLYRASGDFRYRGKALDWWSWFYGNNTKRVKLINERTGGIFDGITPAGLNRNQGAENIVSYLIAYAAMHRTLER